jgi:hypothetical protein
MLEQATRSSHTVARTIMGLSSCGEQRLTRLRLDLGTDGWQFLIFRH